MAPGVRNEKCDTLIYVKASSLRRNLTLNLPKELIRLAKMAAAERGMSLNALAQESLERVVQRQDEFLAAGNRLLAASERGLYSLSKASWSREELYG